MKKKIVNEKLHRQETPRHTVEHQKFIQSTEEKKMSFLLFISVNWIVHRIGWSVRHQKVWKWHGVATSLKFRLQVQQANQVNSCITPEASVQQFLHKQVSASCFCNLQSVEAAGHRKAQAPTEAGCIWLGFREQCCQGSASYLWMPFWTRETTGPKRIAKANAKDGTGKAWDANVVELWLIANLIPAFGGASIINTKCHIGLNCAQTRKGQSTDFKNG